MHYKKFKLFWAYLEQEEIDTWNQVTTLADDNQNLLEFCKAQTQNAAH